MRLAAVAGLAALGLGACGDATNVAAGEESAAGSSSAAGAAETPGTSGTEGELLLRVDVGGGFVPIEANLTHLPMLSVYDDGLVLQPAPMIMIYPGPALPALNASELEDEGLERLQAAVEASGLAAEPPDYGQPPIADAANTMVTITVDGTTYEHVANALREPGEPPWPGLTEEQQAAREQLAEFVAQASDLGALVGEGNLGEQQPWEPERYRLWAQPASDILPGTPAQPAPGPTTTTSSPAGGPAAGPADVTGPDASVSSPAQPPPTGDAAAPTEPKPRLWTWPIDAIDLATVGNCLAVEGGVADEVGALFAQADQLTRFEDDGVAYTVIVRPLLPDEPDCPERG
ncbi:MAG: hypothetical protein GEV08_18265 [Acidimicrobiia bacterium]|nr:hypothetical protein [Acidimicrobiia bacterium]